MKKLVLILFLFLSFTAIAQNEDTAALRSELDSLKMQMSKLEKRVTTWDKIKKHLNISGFLNAGYRYESEYDKTLTTTFHIQRARLKLSGTIFEGKKGAKADYSFHIEFANTPKILDLFIRYQVCNEFGIKFGQYKHPFSIENSEYLPRQLEFINYSSPIRHLCQLSEGMTSRSNNGRDMGLSIIGGFFKQKEGFNVLSYNFGVYNGVKLNTVDNNKAKEFIGRIFVQPIKNLRFATYYKYGMGKFHYRGTKLENFEINIAKDAAGNDIDLKNYVRTERYGAGIDYNSKDAFARAEYIRANTGGIYSEGAYALAGYKFLNQRGNVGVKVDYWDENVKTSFREIDYTISAGYWVWKKYLRLQFEYCFEQFNKGYPDRNYANFMITLSY